MIRGDHEQTHPGEEIVQNKQTNIETKKGKERIARHIPCTYEIRGREVMHEESTSRTPQAKADAIAETKARKGRQSDCRAMAKASATLIPWEKRPQQSNRVKRCVKRHSRTEKGYEQPSMMPWHFRPRQQRHPNNRLQPRVLVSNTRCSVHKGKKHTVLLLSCTSAACCSCPPNASVKNKGAVWE